MKTKDIIRLDKAAFMTEIGNQTLLKGVNGRVVVWHSDNSAVAVVEESGLVTAIGDGDTVIRAEFETGETAECIVSVGYHGQNPILPPTWGLFIADGEPHVFGGRMYIYGSRDNAFGMNQTGRREYCSSDYHVIYSDDLLHWTDAGVSISISDFPDELRMSLPTEEEKKQAHEKGTVAVSKAVDFLWAPDLFKSPKEEKYYLTFCCSEPCGEYFIAESDNPCGPFENIRQLTYRGECMRGIDPGVLVDDDGKVYVALPKPFRLGELDPDKGYAGIIEDSVVYVEDLISSTPDGYYAFEGPSLRKFNGMYYYIYIASKHNQKRPVRMKYLVSENIRSGWRLGGDIIDTFEYLDAGNVHGSIEALHGKMYLAYHRPAVGYNTHVTREMSMEEIFIDEDGIITPAVMTSAGIRGIFEKGEKIPAGSAVYFSGGRSDLRFCHRCREEVPGSLIWRIDGSPYGWFDTVGQSNGYRYADLTGCASVKAFVRTEASGAVLTIRDASSDEIITELSVPDTKKKWTEITTSLLAEGNKKCEFIVELSAAPDFGRVELEWFGFM